MLETYQLGETAVLKTELRNAADALYDPDTSVKVAVWNSAGTAVLAASDMTKLSTGVYYYNLATTTSFVTGCYRVEYTTVNSGAISKAADYFVMADGAAPRTGWCVMTLADQMRSEMDVNPNAAGGKIPDRIAKIVREKGIWLFNHQDWEMRKKSATLSVTAGDTEIAMPGDFKKLDGRTMRMDGTAPYRLIWTEDVSAWQQTKAIIGSTATGRPRIALLYYTDSAWKAKIWPESDRDCDYDFWYLRASPWYGDSPIADNIQLSPDYWPEEFDEGWYALCSYQVYGRYRADDGWKSFKSEFNSWLADHKMEGDETMGDNLEPIQDVMAGLGQTTSALAGWQPAGGAGIWYGSQ